jgi:hypothetical protein
MKNEKNLGCMNGWNGEPAEYTAHKETCGTEYQGKYMLGRPGHFEMRTYRRYDVVSRNLGRCYNEYHCNECGCTWSVDSSD